jgi:capsular exopolysaccharide synthesis family protein
MPTAELPELLTDERVNGYGPPAGAPDRSFDDRHLLDYVRIVYKRRWVAFAILLPLVGALALFNATLVPVYEASVQLQIDPENRGILIFKESIENPEAGDDYQQTQYRILQSRTLAKKTLERLQLWDSPEFEVRAQGVAGMWVTLRAWVERSWTLKIAPAIFPQSTTQPSPALAKTTVAPTEAQILDAFVARISISPVRNSRLVDVKFKATDPELAANAANELARVYIEQNLDRKLQISRQASGWLTHQVEEQRKRVAESEAALQVYREQHGAINPDAPNNIVIQKLTELNSAVTRAKTLRIEREARYRRLQSITNDPAVFDTLPEILSSAYIQLLKGELTSLERQRADQSEQLGERHPEMIKLQAAIRSAQVKLQAEVDKIGQGLKNEYLAAVEQEARLVSALETQKAEALALNRKAIDYAALDREATSNRQVLETLLQRSHETGISGELKDNNIQIIDVADVPREMVSPSPHSIWLLGLLAGSVLAIAMTLAVEYLDDRIQSPEDVKIHLGLPYLGMIPRVRRWRKGGRAPMIYNDAPPLFAEALRTLRSHVLFSSTQNHQTVRSLVVTSTGPKEGKTVVATNLAIALARSGNRVVLIDADLRRPHVHSMFDAPQEPGLANLLLRRVRVRDALRATEVRGLYILPAGLTPPNPADLLGSALFKKLIHALAQQFDWIVFDSPPVLAVTDATVIAHIASDVLFVVAADKTSRRSAQAAIEQLQAAHASLVGGVLNRAQLQRHPYFFAKYYRQEYSSYYASKP